MADKSFTAINVNAVTVTAASCADPVFFPYNCEMIRQSKSNSRCWSRQHTRRYSTRPALTPPPPLLPSTGTQPLGPRRPLLRRRLHSLHRRRCFGSHSHLTPQSPPPLPSPPPIRSFWSCSIFPSYSIIATLRPDIGRPDIGRYAV